MSTLIAQFTVPEPLEEGSVIRFRKYQQEYSFAAIRAGGLWYVTQDGARSSAQGHAPRTWVDLLKFIGSNNYATVELLS